MLSVKAKSDQEERLVGLLVGMDIKIPLSPFNYLLAGGEGVFFKSLYIYMAFKILSTKKSTYI